MNWSREKRQSSERASALASIVFPTPGKSSMISVPLGDEAEDDQAQRLVGRVDDPAEVLDDRLDQPVRGRFYRALSHFGAQPLWISVSTSSRIAAAISSFGAFATVRSPDGPRSVTSLSQASKPMSGRETSLRTKRSAPLRASFVARAVEADLARLGGEADEKLAVAAALAEHREHVGRRLELERPGGRRPSGASQRAPRRAGSRRLRRP